MPPDALPVRNSAKTGALAVQLRPYDPGEDMNLIVNSHMKNYWIHGMRNTSRAAGLPIEMLDPESYSVNQRAFLLNALETGRETGGVIIACSPGDPWFVFGYLVGELGGPAPVVHYVFVKLDYRHQGIAGLLLRELINRHGASRKVVFTHWTERGGKALTEWLRRAGLTPVWDPYLAR